MSVQKIDDITDALAEISPAAEEAAPSPLPPFEAWQKIYRLNREVIVTEKVDGTNGVIHVAEDGRVLAGSRSKWVTLADDNHGFARWVAAHEDELRTGLGFGTHYGEWWGAGIGRRYGLTEKRFSLFNVTRWTDEVRPACCHVVAELARGIGFEEPIHRALRLLRAEGSRAAPGFMKPEGIVAFHTASRELYKVTLEKDESPKGAA